MAESKVEEWRKIEQAPDYAISDQGRVKRLVDKRYYKAGGLLTLGMSYDGYKTVMLYVNTKQILRRTHNLVCRAWHGNPPTPEHHAAHWNGDKLDNRPENLRWATAAENNEDIHRHGRGTFGDRNGRRNDANRARAKAIKTAIGRPSEIARRYGVSAQHVYAIKTGLRWPDI